MQRRRGFFGRLADALRDFLGTGGTVQPPASSPPEVEIVEEPTPPYEPPEEAHPPQGPDFIDFFPTDNVYYIDGKRTADRRGRMHYSYARWRVDEPEITDVRDILNRRAGPFLTIIIRGIPCEAYPTKPGQYDIWLSYRVQASDAKDVASYPNVISAEDWINNLVGAQDVGNCWDTVYSIDIVDKD